MHNFVYTTVLFKVQYDQYIGSHLGEYIPEICVEPALTDPAEYYVQGWEGFFNTIGTTTITKDICIWGYTLYPPLTFEVTLNATHPKPCLEMEYSNIASNVHDVQVFLLKVESSRQFIQLVISNTCKSIMQDCR